MCSEEELKVFIAAIDQPIVRAAVETGVRSGEVTNLKCEDIDYQFNCIHVIGGNGGKYGSLPIAISLLPVIQQYEQISRNSD